MAHEDPDMGCLLEIAVAVSPMDAFGKLPALASTGDCGFDGGVLVADADGWLAVKFSGKGLCGIFASKVGCFSCSEVSND